MAVKSLTHLADRTTRHAALTIAQRGRTLASIPGIPGIRPVGLAVCSGLASLW
jgi:hypothetical protein